MADRKNVFVYGLGANRSGNGAVNITEKHGTQP